MKYRPIQAMNEQHMSKSVNDLQHVIQHVGPPFLSSSLSVPCTSLISCVVRERSAILNQPVGTEKWGQRRETSLQESKISTWWHFSVDKTRRLAKAPQLDMSQEVQTHNKVCKVAVLSSFGVCYTWSCGSEKFGIGSSLDFCMCVCM